MLIFLEKHLAFLAVPKTGTTAVEMALRPHADIIFSKGRKHVPAMRFRNKVAPFLKDTFGADVETVAVMREPVDQIRSWYKYRKSERQKGQKNSTEGLDFDDFVTDVIAPEPPVHAAINSQFKFLCNARGKLLVDHLFAYECQELFLDFMSDRLGRSVDLKRKNVSPEVPAELSPDIEASLRRERRDEFALYDRLIDREGYLEG